MKKRFSQTVISGAVLLAVLTCTGIAQAAEKTVDASNSEGFTAADGVSGNTLLIKDGADVSGSLYGALNDAGTPPLTENITVDMSGGTITKKLYGGSGGSADGIKVTVSGGLINSELIGFESFGGSAKNISLNISGSAEVSGRAIGANTVGEADGVTVKAMGGTLNSVYGVYSSNFTTSVQNTLLEIGGDVSISGTSGEAAVAVKTTTSGTFANNVLKITGGSITGINSNDATKASVAAVNIGPTAFDKTSPLIIQGNSLEISGGTIKNSNVYAVNAWSASLTSADITDTTLQISGGDIEAGVIAAVFFYPDKTSVNNSTVSISEGSISASGIYGAYLDRTTTSTTVGSNTINISGGEFKPSAGQTSIKVAGFKDENVTPENNLQGTSEINLDGSAHSDGLDLGVLAFSGTNSKSAAMNVAGNITASTSITDFNTISLAKGATLKTEELTQTKDLDTPTQINLQDTSNKITIGTLNADLAVNGSGEMNDAGENAQASIKAAQDAITVTGDKKGAIKKIELAEGELAGKIVAEDTGNGLQITEQAANSKQMAYQSLRALQTLQWRHELNDLTKRMGELRTSPTGVGSWARLYGSEQEYGPQSMTMRNTSIQVGTDGDLGSGWKVGGAFSYTDGSADYNLGDADTKAWSLGIYGTWLEEDGQFVDLMAKYHRLSTDFRLNNYDGSYDNNAFSVSAEYGWHLKLSELGFVEPQVELTYGRIMGDDFNAGTSVRVEQKDLDTLIGRAGLRSGFYLPQNKGTVYARVSGAYDFLGDEEYTARAGSRTETFKTDLGGAWVEYAVGANFNLTDRSYAYVDLERTSGGETQENWRWNLGLRYIW